MAHYLLLVQVPVHTFMCKPVCPDRVLEDNFEPIRIEKNAAHNLTAVESKKLYHIRVDKSRWYSLLPSNRFTQAWLKAKL